MHAFYSIAYASIFTAGSPLVPVLGALAVLEPFRMVYFYGMVPLPMIAAAVLCALADLTGLFIPSQVAHSVHLVGMFVGVIVGLYLKRVGEYGYGGYFL